MMSFSSHGYTSFSLSAYKHQQNINRLAWSILIHFVCIGAGPPHLNHSHRRQKGNSFACDVNSWGGPTPMQAKWIKLDVLSSHGLRLVETKSCPLLELNANKQGMRHAIWCWQGRCIFENLNAGLALVPVFVLFRIWVKFNNHLCVSVDHLITELISL